MSDIRWDILRPVDIGGQFQEGYQGAQRNALMQQERAYQNEERQRAQGLRNALSGAVNPTTGAIDYGVARRAYIGAGDVQGAIGVNTAESAEAARRLALRKNDIRIGARLIREGGAPADAAGYQQYLAAARQAGANIEGAPPTWDPATTPQYLAALLRADAASQDPSEGYTLGRGDVRIGANGQEVARGAPELPRYYPVQPGGRLELDPSYQGPTTEMQATPAQPGGQAQPWATEEAPAFRAAPQSADEINAAAEAAIRQGRNPEMVRQRQQQLLQQLNGGGAAPGPQTFP